jgi:hypothetical protein
LKKVEAVEATWENKGNIEYYQCSACGKYFSDAKGTHELNESELFTVSNTTTIILIAGICGAGVLLLGAAGLLGIVSTRKKKK